MPAARGLLLTQPRLIRLIFFCLGRGAPQRMDSISLTDQIHAAFRQRMLQSDEDDRVMHNRDLLAYLNRSPSPDSPSSARK